MPNRVSPTQTNETSGNFFTGHKDYDNMSYDPYVSGYAFLLWTKVPSWLGNALNGNGSTEKFKKLTQKNFKALSGLGDISLDTVGSSRGFAGNETQHASSITKENNEITLTHEMYSGSPLVRYYKYWVTGIRDPETGIATYPVRDEVDAGYGIEQHSGEFLYVVTRPDANNTEGGQNIEFAAYFTQVFPNTIPLDPYNFEEGSHDNHDIEQTFSCVFHTSPKVYEYAANQIEKRYDFKTMHDYDPGSTDHQASDSTDADGSLDGTGISG